MALRAPRVLERHDWLAYDVLKAATAMYKERGTGADPPLTFYGINVARALLKDEARKKGRPPARRPGRRHA